MSIKGTIGMILLFAGLGYAGPFTGEVYQIGKYTKQVTLRGPDLSTIRDGQTLYVCDGNNRQVATVRVTRFYTTVIETTLVTGDVKALKIKMPVYQDVAQFQDQQPAAKVQYDQDFDYYWWQVRFAYRVPSGEALRDGKVLLSKLIEVRATGYDQSVKLDPDEISSFFLDKTRISGILLKNGARSDLTSIDARFSGDWIPDVEVTNADQMGRKVTRFGVDNVREMRLVKRLNGADWKSLTVPFQSVVVGGMEFVYIPAGEFMMGSPEGEGGPDEHPRHRVRVPGFWMARYEVTQAQWKEIMGANPSRFEGSDWPVERVSWNDCREFCRKFNNLYGAALRLPAEAEWEYACRAGSTNMYYWGKSMNGDFAWFAGNYAGKTYPVGRKKPNAWGLYDMSGNVWEWCQDWYQADYYASGRPDGSLCTNAASGTKVLRGGSWVNEAPSCTSAYRSTVYGPAFFYNTIGLRPAMSP